MFLTVAMWSGRSMMQPCKLNQDDTNSTQSGLSTGHL
jgi:hypothetical protein